MHFSSIPIRTFQISAVLFASFTSPCVDDPICSKRLGAITSAWVAGRTLCHEAYSRVVGTLYSSVITRNVGQFVTFALLNIVQDVFNGCVEEGVILMQELVGIAWCAIPPLALSRKGLLRCDDQVPAPNQRRMDCTEVPSYSS